MARGAFVALLDGQPMSGWRRLRIGSPGTLTEGMDVTLIRWDASTGMIFAAATGEESRSLWTVSPETREVAPFEPAVVFGTDRAIGFFDLSQEGRMLVFSRENLAGDIWVSEGPPGLYRAHRQEVDDGGCKVHDRRFRERSQGGRGLARQHRWGTGRCNLETEVDKTPAERSSVRFRSTWPRCAGLLSRTSSRSPS